MVTNLAIIFLFHYIFDYLLQRRVWAKKKWKDFKALQKHCLTYTVGMAMVGVALFGLVPGLAFGLANGALHLATDYYSSKLSHHFQVAGNGAGLIYTYGADQLLHQLALLGTYGYFCGVI